MGVYKKKDDERFATGFREFNDPAVKLSALDGSIAMLLRNESYPKASLLSQPATADYSTILENIASGKADLTFVERAVANNYIKANPEKIEDITGTTPFVVYPYILPVAKSEQDLISMFNQAATLLHLSGFIEETLNKHAPGDYVPVDAYKHYKMTE
jgi:ABC-type amino acid transport substrate-binding protein